MTDSEKLDLILSDMQSMKSEMQSMNSDIQSIKSEIRSIHARQRAASDRIEDVRVDLELVSAKIDKVERNLIHEIREREDLEEIVALKM